MLTFFRRCDDCGTRVAEVGQVGYEPRFAAMRVERQVVSPIIEAPPVPFGDERMPKDGGGPC